MAEFNPSAGGIPAPNMPDQTGASRGITPNRSWEALFSGVGDIVGGVTGVIDNGIKHNIKDNVNDIWGEANKPYDVPPADLSKGTESIRTLHAAWEQGKLSDVHYYGMLNTELKNLRAKYPGYEDVVDATMESVTGVRPANAYRNAIVAELNAQDNAKADTEKAWDSWYQQNERTVNFLHPDYAQNPDKYNRAEIRGETARYLGIKENDTYIKDMNKDAVYATSAASLSLDVNTVVANLPKMMGLDESKNIYTILQEAGNVNTSSETLLNLTAKLDGLILQQTQSIDAQMLQVRQAASSKPGDPPISWFSIMGKEKADQVKAQVLAPLMNIRNYINKGDFSLAAYNTQLIDAQKNDNVKALLNGPGGEVFQTKMAMDTIDPIMFQTWAAKNSTIVDTAYTKAIPELMAQIVKGNRNFNQTAETIASDTTVSEADRGVALNTMITDVNSTLGKGSVATPDDVAKTVNNVYKLTNGKDVFNLVETKDYMNVYNRLFANDITETIKKSGNPDALKTYHDAALDRFIAVPEFRQAGTLLQKFITEKNNYSINMDQSGQITVSLKMKEPKAGSYDALGYRVQQAATVNANNALRALNNSFHLLDPIILGENATGEDRDKAHLSLLKMLSVQYDAGQQEDFFDWVGKSLHDMVTPKDVENKSSWKDVVPKDISFNIPDQVTGDLGSYYNSVAQAESGGDPNAKNPNSSASGLYQFTDGTWDDYASELGLTDKSDPVQQQIAMEAFTKDNDNKLTRANLPVTNANRYAAHFLGGSGAAYLLANAPDTDPVKDWITPAQYKANKSVLAGMTVADFKAWTERQTS